MTGFSRLRQVGEIQVCDELKTTGKNTQFKIQCNGLQPAKIKKIDFWHSIAIIVMGKHLGLK